MDKIIKNILKKIENEGYEAYIVGGYVRDLLLGKRSFDVDICTSILPKDIIKILPLSQKGNGYGGFTFKIKKYNIDITTYRKEIKYEKRHPVEIEYISNLEDDIQRRDFTINALCLDKNGKIIDLQGGINDLNKKIIKSIGSPSEKFKEDPLRILRAVRFATTLDFGIENNTYKEMEKNAIEINNLSPDAIKKELSKILSSKNFKKGLNLLKELGIDKLLKLEYDNIIYTDDIIGMYSQVSCAKINYTSAEKETISKVREIIKKGKIEDYDLFNHGLYASSIAADILGISKKQINKIYKKMPIKSMKDIDISGKEIITILKIVPGKLISEILNDVKIEILNHRLKNNNAEIKKYIIGKWNHE